MSSPCSCVWRSSPIEPFPLLLERPRGTQTSEAWLKLALNLLIDPVQAQYRGLEIKRRRMRTPLLSGLMCPKRRTPCFGDTRMRYIA